MKWVIFFLIFFHPLMAWTKCPNPADPLKVMLFIDTNNNILEIEAAKEAACIRGESLVIIPHNYNQFSELKKRVHQSKLNFEKCKGDCEKYQAKEAKAKKELETLIQKQASLQSQINLELSKIKKAKGKLKNIIISGHDGGGIYKGSVFETNRSELSKIFKQYPTVNEVSSLLLLGCYATVQKEVLIWKEILPHARLIAGYDAGAPLGIRPAGHDFIRSILIKEANLLALADEKEIQKYLKNGISRMRDLNTSVYLKPYCEEGQNEKEYFYGQFEDKRQLSTLDLRNCNAVLGKLQEGAETLIKFTSGELDPEKPTDYNILRLLYQFSRKYEHCIDSYHIPINVNSIFNLVFYEEEKNNFALFYKNDIARAAEVIIESNFLAFKIWIPNQENLGRKTYKETLQNINTMHGILASSGLSTKEREAIRFLSSAMTKHLQHFENPFSWFEIEDKVEAPEDPEKLN